MTKFEYHIMKYVSILSVGILALTLTACKEKQPDAQTPVNHLQQSFTMDEARYDRPLMLFVQYHVPLSKGRTLVLKSMQTPWTSLYENGIELEATLTQTDGRTVDFNCEAVADKILDPILVPEVEQTCYWLVPMTRKFWAETPPTSFTDDTGRLWRLE